MYLLFMALDVDSEEGGERDELGRTLSLPNAAIGDGVDDDDYHYLVSKDLVTWDEVKVLKGFQGLKCLLPMKWALVELREMCAPENRMVNSARNYEALQVLGSLHTSRASLYVLRRRTYTFSHPHCLPTFLLTAGHRCRLQ